MLGAHRDVHRGTCRDAHRGVHRGACMGMHKGVHRVHIGVHIGAA